jgi:hypothetical protein
MIMRYAKQIFLFALLAAVVPATAVAEKPGETKLTWATVVNNNDLMPPLDMRNFNSYNPPSVNEHGMVVIRARSRGGPPLGPPTHGIYVRDMSRPDSAIERILDKTTRVPHPNNLGTQFVETPSFPRIDAKSPTIVTRGNHGPGWRYMQDDGTETRAGTTGVYTNPYGELVTGAAKLGQVPEFSFYGVPEFSGVHFEVFPGAPSVTDGDTIAFKGNYTVDGIAKTGVYFRKLTPGPSGGTSPSILIANNTDTLIPGTRTVFGSTAPPNAADGKVVFAGFDDEEAPTLGGIYLAPLEFQPRLTLIVGVGEAVPDAPRGATFAHVGEGISFDGRYVGFWGAWGTGTRTIRLYCPGEGNRDRIDFCNQQLVCRDTGEVLGDPNSICDDTSDMMYGTSCYVDREVPLNQGIFVHDTRRGYTQLAARTGEDFEDFVYWNYSGKPPCVGSGHSSEGGEDDGEMVRWRSSAFLSVAAANGTTFHVAFKANAAGRAGGLPITGIYLKRGPGKAPPRTVIDTTMSGAALDPYAPPGSLVSEVGIEREGLRGRWLAINAKMGIEGAEEEDDMAGIYIARLKKARR